MKFNEEEMKIITNFQKIDNKLYFQDGYWSTTNNPIENYLVAFYDVKRDGIPEFGLNDLSNFINVIKKSDPDFEVKSSHILLNNEAKNVKIRYSLVADKSIIKPPPIDALNNLKSFASQNTELKFTMTSEVYETIFRYSGLFGSTTAFFISDGTKLRIVLSDSPDLKKATNPTEIGIVDEDVQVNNLKGHTAIDLKNMLFLGDTDYSVTSANIDDENGLFIFESTLFGVNYLVSKNIEE